MQGDKFLSLHGCLACNTHRVVTVLPPRMTGRLKKLWVGWYYLSKSITSKHAAQPTCCSGYFMAASRTEAYSSSLSVLAEELGSASSLQASSQSWN